MNIKKLEEGLEQMKSDMGDSLIRTAIWSTADGQVLSGVNPDATSAALFNRLTDLIQKTLESSKFPTLEDYYIFKLEENLALVILLDGYSWGVLAKADKIQLGLLLNVIVPNAQSAFAEAVK